jgi:hypothetical protein
VLDSALYIKDTKTIMKLIKYIFFSLLGFLLLMMGALIIYFLIWEENYNPRTEAQLDSILASSVQLSEVQLFLEKNVKFGHLKVINECEENHTATCYSKRHLISFPVGRPDLICGRSAFLYEITISENNIVELVKKEKTEPPPHLNTPPYTYVEVQDGQKETLQLLRR